MQEITNPNWFRGVQHRSSGFFHSITNVRGRVFYGPPRRTAAEAALDSDAARFWLKLRGKMTRHVTPNFPETWAHWSSERVNTPALFDGLKAFLDSVPDAPPTSRIAPAAIPPVAVALKVLSGLDKLLAAPSPRLTVEQLETLRAARATLQTFVA